MVFRCEPVLKERIWGGTRLREEYGKESCLTNIAESWELSGHPEGISVAGSGKYKGMTITELMKLIPDAFGKAAEYRRLPILVKLIDARDDLSVQVHPTRAYAEAHPEAESKDEMWYIADCCPDSSIIYGFREDITETDLRSALVQGDLLEKVNIIPVKKGDVFYIPAGMLHAIGKGCLVAEIQQSSDTTFRVYDYDRIDSSGNKRQLHIEEAAAVLDMKKTAVPKQEHGETLVECPYFSVYRDIVPGIGKTRSIGTSFTHLLILEGEGILYHGTSELEDEPLTVKKGESFFIAAGTHWQIKGNCSIIYTVI